MKKKATTAAIIIGTALSVSLPVYGAQWKQDSTGWWYEQDNGSYPAGGWDCCAPTGEMLHDTT